MEFPGYVGDELLTSRRFSRLGILISQGRADEVFERYGIGYQVEEMEPGDIIHTPHHVMIYVGSAGENYAWVIEANLPTDSPSPKLSRRRIKSNWKAFRRYTPKELIARSALKRIRARLRSGL